MTWPAWLRPALDVLVPGDPASAARRVRNTAVWAAVAAWLLPAHPALGTGTTPHRAWICGAFVVVAVLAHLAKRGRRWSLASAAACLVAGALVRVFGGWWGVAFVVFAALVVGMTALRVRFVAFADEPREFDRLPPLPGGAPRFLAFYAWLGISILLMKEFAAQAMVVPTGSMQPTIMGGGQRGFPTVPTSSGIFGRMLFGLYSGTQFTGDHLVCDEFSYLFRDPRRFEIVVFEFPLFRERYFVKRVIGLPGEHVEIKDGDIWVDGKPARKPRIVQETLWRELFPRKSPGAAPKRIVDGFRSSGPWKPLSETEVLASPKVGERTFAQFTGTDLPSDLRVAFTATPQQVGKGTDAWARITSRGGVVALQASVYGGEVSIDGKSVAQTAAPLRAGARVELCVVDGEAWATIDGHETRHAAMPPGVRGKSGVEIGASGPMSFRDVRVCADIVYEAGGGKAAWDVPKDSFFFLGDNVKNSQDSRAWSAEVFHPPGGAPTLSARLCLVSETGSDESAPNVRVVGDHYEFVDVDGVARKVPVAGTTVDHSSPAPFARREHLIGRAVMTFWPFFTPDAGFRPRLIP